MPIHEDQHHWPSSLLVTVPCASVLLCRLYCGGASTEKLKGKGKGKNKGGKEDKARERRGIRKGGENGEKEEDPLIHTTINYAQLLCVCVCVCGGGGGGGGGAMDILIESSYHMLINGHLEEIYRFGQKIKSASFGKN